MAEMLPARADLHGMVLPGDRGAGGLLADYMRSLFARMESVDAVEAPFIAHATVNMMAACFQPSVYANARASANRRDYCRSAEALYRRESCRADLSADALCGRFRISRTQLYRMFEPLGGVASYIQARRLDRAFAQLRDPRTSIGGFSRSPSTPDFPASRILAGSFESSSDSARATFVQLRTPRPRQRMAGQNRAGR